MRYAVQTKVRNLHFGPFLFTNHPLQALEALRKAKREEKGTSLCSEIYDSHTEQSYTTTDAFIKVIGGCEKDYHDQEESC